MNKSPCKYSLLPLLLGSLLASAQAEEPNADALPHAFSNGSAADADEVNANFEFLRNNVDLMVDLLQAQQTRIEQLEAGAAAAPFEFSVDCAGGTLSSVVDPVLDAMFPLEAFPPLVVSVSGTCSGETTIIDIDGVTIRSADPDNQAVFTDAIVVTGEGNQLILENLTINNPTTGGVVCRDGASLNGTNLTIQANGTGVFALQGSCYISDSTITGNGVGRGAGANLGGVIVLRGVSISDFGLGLNAVENGMIAITPSLDGSTRSQVSNNSNGVLVFAGGNVTLAATDVFSNSVNGIFVQPGGSAIFSGGPQSNVIDDNPTGIRIDNGGSLFAFIGSAPAVVSNSDTGISCTGTFVLGLGSTPDLSDGNTIPDNNCNILP